MTRTEEDYDDILFVRKGLPDSNEYTDNYYYDPYKFKAMLGPVPKVKQQSQFGELSPGSAALNTLPFPPLEVGDVIVDPQTDKRYQIDRIRTIEMLGAPIEQQAQLDLIMADDEIYNISTDGY